MTLGSRVVLPRIVLPIVYHLSALSPNEELDLGNNLRAVVGLKGSKPEFFLIFFAFRLLEPDRKLREADFAVVHNQINRPLLVLLSEEFVGKRPHKALVGSGSLLVFLFLLLHWLAVHIEPVNDQNLFFWLSLAVEFDYMELFLLRTRDVAVKEIFFVLVARLLPAVALRNSQFWILVDQKLFLQGVCNCLLHVIG